MRRVVPLILSIAFDSLPVGAHPNHEHKAMGVVQAVEEGAVHVESEGERTTFLLTKDTQVLRGDTRIAAKDLVVGERVVVVYVEDKEQKLARRVLVGGEKKS